MESIDSYLDITRADTNSLHNIPMQSLVFLWPADATTPSINLHSKSPLKTNTVSSYHRLSTSQSSIKSIEDINGSFHK